MAPIVRHLPADDRLLARLHDRLASAGQVLRDDEMTVFVLSVAGDGDDMAGGCKGEIAFTSAHVSELWVADELRGAGIGSRLLAEAEQVAIEHGCDRIHLETRNPKARDLDLKLGYEVFGELPMYEGDNSFYYLTKTLSPPR